MLLSGTVATGLVYYKEFDDERSIDYRPTGASISTSGGFSPMPWHRCSTRGSGSTPSWTCAPRGRETTVAAGTPARALAEDRARVRRPRRTGLDVRRGHDLRWRAAQPDAQLDHEDHRGRPGAVPDAAHDVLRHRVAPDRSVRRGSGARLRHVQDSADDSHGGAGDHSGLARGRLPPLLGARP